MRGCTVWKSLGPTIKDDQNLRESRYVKYKISKVAELGFKKHQHSFYFPCIIFENLKQSLKIQNKMSK